MPVKFLTVQKEEKSRVGQLESLSSVGLCVGCRRMVTLRTTSLWPFYFSLWKRLQGKGRQLSTPES